MAKYIFPAIFTKENEMYSVFFPDLKGCYTQCDNLSDAYEMASDVLCLTLYNLEEENKKIPVPSEPSAIKTEKNEFVSLVSCDTLEYRQYYDTKTVNKRLYFTHD